MSLVNVVNGFASVDLAVLDERARLMQRINRKYVLDGGQLPAFMRAMQPHFDALEIDGSRRFEYSNVYLDSPRLATFVAHNQGRRKRFKLRFRRYCDSDEQFFEVKIKGFRGETVKYRMPVESSACHCGILSPELTDFLNASLDRHDYRRPVGRMRPVIEVRYRRMTLVDRHEPVRVTIDSDVTFAAGERRDALPSCRHIVEIKSAQGRSLADRWLLGRRVRPVKQCSKYGMGVNLLLAAHRNTRFSPVIRRQFSPALP